MSKKLEYDLDKSWFSTLWHPKFRVTTLVSIWVFWAMVPKNLQKQFPSFCFPMRICTRMCRNIKWMHGIPKRCQQGIFAPILILCAHSAGPASGYWNTLRTLR
jgi:hypothetical protein